MEITVTKLVHACLLVEANGKRILIDPGSYTLHDERFDLTMVEGMDRILITHEHADHMSPELITNVLERSNDAVVETNASVARLLAAKDIAAVTEGTPRFVAPHERIPIGPGPENTGFHVEGVLSHPGDSHSFAESMPILAMPFMAPWGSLVGGVDRARLVKAKHVIPIHDWPLSQGGRQFMYTLAGLGLKSDDIDLVVIDDFESTVIGT